MKIQHTKKHEENEAVQELHRREKREKIEHTHLIDHKISQYFFFFFEVREYRTAQFRYRND